MKNQVAIVIALVLGVLAVIAVRAHLKNVESEKSSETKPVDVVMARRDIERGEPIKLDNVEKATASRSVLKGTTTIPWSEKEYYVNMYQLQEKVPKGKFITKEMLLKTAQATMARELSSGERAITIAVDQVSGNAGYLSPGDHVDVLATFTVPATGAAGQSRAEIKTYVLLTNVKVLRTGARTSQATRTRYGVRETPYTTVTFKTTPEASHLLAYAQATGRFSLVLRAPGDIGKYKKSMMGMTDLINTVQSRPK